jgi:hypothetical protein
MPNPPATRDLANPDQELITETEALLEKWKHPDPYRPPTAPGGELDSGLRYAHLCILTATGSKYERNLPAPILDRKYRPALAACFADLCSPPEDDIVAGLGSIAGTLCTYLLPTDQINHQLDRFHTCTKFSALSLVVCLYAL